MNLIEAIDLWRVRTRGWAALLLAACWLFDPSAAAAQCQVDADCGPGYHCAIGQGGGCGSGPCSADGVCPPPVCETFEYRYCDVAPCATDADCPDSMRCHTERWQECTDWATPTCARGEVCDAGPPREPSCSEHERSVCMERYHLPCEADDDCGAGFECVESVSGGCSGGGAVRPDGDGGYIVEQFPSECWSEPTGEYYCKLLDLPCATDADCLDGLTCQPDYLTAPPCAGASLGGTGSGEPPVVVDCGVPPAPTYSCKPPRYGGAGVGGGGIAGGGTIGGSSGEFPDGDAGVTAPGAGSVGGFGGPGGGAPGGSGDPGTPPADEEEGEESGDGRGSRLGRLLRRLFGPGGCSAAGTGPAADLSWLAVTGLLLGLAHRRRNR